MCGPRNPRHGIARFACTTGRCARTIAAAIHFTESSGRFFPAVERRISIWSAHRLCSSATRVRAAESRSINPFELFSPMDAAEGSKSQISKAKSQNVLTTDCTDSTDENYCDLGLGICHFAQKLNEDRITSTLWLPKVKRARFARVTGFCSQPWRRWSRRFSGAHLTSGTTRLLSSQCSRRHCDNGSSKPSSFTMRLFIPPACICG